MKAVFLCCNMKSLLLILMSLAVVKIYVFLMDSKVYSKRSHLAILLCRLLPRCLLVGKNALAKIDSAGYAYSITLVSLCYKMKATYQLLG